MATNWGLVLLSFLTKRPSGAKRLGVVIDAAGVALALVDHATGAPRLQACRFRRLEAGEAPARVLAELVRAEQWQKLPTNLVLAPGEFSLQLIEALPVDAAELKAAVRWRVRGLLDYPIDEAVIDVFDLPGQRGGVRMMYVVAARITTLQRRIEALASAGLDLKVIDIPELAQRNLAALLPEDGDGVALVALVGGEARITITRAGTLYLARMLHVGEAVAPLAGVSVGNLALDQTLQPEAAGLDALVLEVQRSLDYHDSHFSHAPITRLVLTPPSVQVSAAVARLSNGLDIRSRVLALAELLPGAEAWPEEVLAECLPAIGAALRVEEKVS